MDRGFGNESDTGEFGRPPQPDTNPTVGQVDSAPTSASFAPGQLPPPSVAAAPATGAAQPERHFAPPVPSNVRPANVVAAGSAAAGPTGDMAAGHSTRSRRPVVIALVALAALLIAGVTLFGILQGGGSEATAKPRFPRDPTRQYSVDIGASDDLDDVVIAGKSSRIAIVIVGFEHDELRVFDQAGAQLWQRRSDGALQVLAAGDDFLVIEDEGDARFVLLDGRTGDERWTTDIGWYDQVVVFDDSVLLSHDDEIEVFALSDGKRLASVPIDNVGDTDVDITVGLAATGQIAVWVDDEVRVYDRRLQQVGATIPADGGDFASVLSGKVLVADDGELDRYGTDGKLQASDRFAVNWLVPVEGSTWLYGNDHECGALEFSGDAVAVLWTIDTCDFREFARSGSGQSYAVVLDQETTDDRWVDVSNGEVLRATPGYLELTADGVFETNDNRFEAFQNDGGTRIYTQRRAGDQYMFLVDDALVMIDIGSRTAEMTVFS